MVESCWGRKGLTCVFSRLGLCYSTSCNRNANQNWCLLNTGKASAGSRSYQVAAPSKTWPQVSQQYKDLPRNTPHLLDICVCLLG